MKAVVFSDRFFVSEVFEKAIQDVPFWRNVRRVYFDVGWPQVPLSCSRYLKEYVPYPESALQEVQDAEILVTQMGCVDKRLLINAPHLQVVGCLRSGPVNVDREALKEKKIPLISAPERSVEAVAEFTIGLFIIARRKIFQSCKEAKEGNWTQNMYFVYEQASPGWSETVVGLIGFGRIARRVATLLMPFRPRRVLAYDPYVGEDVMRQYGVEKVDLQYLLQNSDIVSLHVRCTGSNREMLGEQAFSMMKRGSIFVNTARGELVDEKALFQALKKGRPAFACIDTCCHEPWSGRHIFTELDNVVLTPHIAGASRSTVEEGARAIAQGIADYFKNVNDLSRKELEINGVFPGS